MRRVIILTEKEKSKTMEVSSASTSHEFDLLIKMQRRLKGARLSETRLASKN